MRRLLALVVFVMHIDLVITGVNEPVAIPSVA